MATSNAAAYRISGINRGIKANSTGTQPTDIPGGQKALDVVQYASQNKGAARPGYKGGANFANDGRGGGQTLPNKDSNGGIITYKEYDVNPYQKGTSRGTERVVIVSDGKSFYTDDHYGTFTEIPQQ